jgi:alpha-beta hydrolase superfamily lysophospholipase
VRLQAGWLNLHKERTGQCHPVISAGGDVTLRTYPGARHEILNETNRAQVVRDLTDWLDRILAARD